MKGLRDLQIDIFSLGLKLHEFEFDVDDKLFAQYEYSLIEKGHGKCFLTLQKSETMMTLQFGIDVKVELICDRSLDPFEYPVSLNETLIIKFGEQDDVLSEDVIVIKHDTSSINVGDYIYEYITLAVPMKKLHPRYDEESAIEEELIYTSDEEENTSEEQIDPRWEALKKLKDNK